MCFSGRASELKHTPAASAAVAGGKLTDWVQPPVAMLPFRRRDFEVDALMREIICCADRGGALPWGRTLPPNAAELTARRPTGPRRIHLVWDETSKSGRTMKTSLQRSLEALNGRYHYTQDRRITCTGDVSDGGSGASDMHNATHVIVMLTDTHEPKGGTPWLAAGTPANEQLAWAVANITKPRRNIVFVYDKPLGINSDVFNLSETIKPDAVKYSIWGHEALIFRPDGIPRLASFPDTAGTVSS